MNVKLHTPKSLKLGSGMTSIKQFLLSLFATTVSIALTFGTAAIIDYYKKKSEKREIVMMVMYDMYNSLKSVETADSMIRQSMQLQLQIAQDTTKYDNLKFKFIGLIPKSEYTETTERILSSSIETINTVGNVLFVENVAEFYQERQYYKTNVCDSLFNELTQNHIITNLNQALNFDFFSYAIASNAFITDMHKLFAECKQIMKVTDKEMEAYWNQRRQIKEGISDEDISMKSAHDETIRLQKEIDKAKAELK
jgi:ABC-type dipeptide/oligopeptide/nickel transport system ATPase subunit